MDTKETRMPKRRTLKITISAAIAALLLFGAPLALRLVQNEWERPDTITAATKSTPKPTATKAPTKAPTATPTLAPTKAPTTGATATATPAPTDAAPTASATTPSPAVTTDATPAATPDATPTVAAEPTWTAVASPTPAANGADAALWNVVIGIVAVIGAAVLLDVVVMALVHRNIARRKG
jgi:cytoskeletal protein RodZ